MLFRSLIGTERLTGLPYYTTGLYEMAVSGKVFREYRLPGGYHHDQFEMEDGNILVLTQDADAPTVEDVCVLIHKDTGEILKRWDYKSVLPQDRGKSGSWDDREMCIRDRTEIEEVAHELVIDCSCDRVGRADDQRLSQRFYSDSYIISLSDRDDGGGMVCYSLCE